MAQTIHIDLVARLQERQLRRDADKLEANMARQFQSIGDTAGSAMGDAFGRAANPRIAKAAKKAGEAADVLALKESNLAAARQKSEGTAKRVTQLEASLAKARQESGAESDAAVKIETQLTRARITAANTSKQSAKATYEHAAAVRQLGDAQQSLGGLNRQLNSVSTAGDGAVQSMASLGQTMAGLGKVLGPVGIAAAVSGLVQLGGVAATVSQSVGLLPGVLGAAGAAFGTLKIATLGFGDALDSMRDPEKFTEALRELSPNAQQAANSIRGLLPAFDELKAATQDALFAGIRPQLESLAGQYKPTLQQMTVGIADSFNGMFDGIADELARPGTQAAIQNFTTNINEAFQNLTPVVGPLVQAFAELTSVGSEFLPEIATAAADAAREFAAFIQEASRSGELRTWIREGLDAIKEFGPILGSVVDIFMSLRPAGEDVLPRIADGLATLADVMPVIVEGFTKWMNIIGAVQESVTLLLPNLSAIGDVATAVADVASGSMERVVNAMNAMLEPIRAAIDLANKIPGVNLTNIPEFSAQANGGNQQGGGPGASVERRGRPTSIADLPSGAPLPGSAGSSAAGGTNGTWGDNPWSRYVTGPASSGGGGGGGYSGRGYGYSGDQALLSGVPAGSYSQTGSADLTQGIGDCTSAIEDLIAIIDGDATAGRSMSTANAPEWLAAHGFVQGRGGPGDFRVGFNDGHMQATLPGGTPFNWGSDSAAARRGIGGTGADDPAFTDHWYRPTEASKTQNDVNVQNISTEAAGKISKDFTDGMAKIDDDFGLSRGLPGLIENAVKAIGNIALAGPMALLNKQAQDGGSAGPGSGLLGLLAGPKRGQGTNTQSSAYSPQAYSPGGGIPAGIPGSPGGSPSTAPGVPGLGSFAQSAGQPGIPTPQNPNAAAAQGYGAGRAAATSYGAGAQPFGGIGAPGTSATPTLGRAQGEGQPASGGVGVGGGLIGAAQSAVVSAASAAASMGTMGGAGGGAGAGAQILMDLANRAVSFGGQAAGIGVQGLLETILPSGGSELASNNWLTKIAGAVAGVRPAADNLAGQLTEKSSEQAQGPLTPEQIAIQKGKDAAAAKGAGGNTTQNVTVNNNNASPDANGTEISRHLQTMNAARSVGVGR